MLTQEYAEEKINDRCKEINYTLLKPFVYINVNTKIKLKCDNNHIIEQHYNGFINNKNKCKYCRDINVGISKRKLENDVYKILLEKCKTLNYKLLKKFVYKNNKTKFQLKCNKDNYEWYTNFSNFINHNRNCPKCGKSLILSQNEVNKKIKDRCNELNYSIIENFIYKNNNSKIYLKCNKDNYEWYTTYKKFINTKHSCPKCKKTLKLNQKEAEESINNKCNELNYTLLKTFIYLNNKTKIHLKCNIDNHIWSPTYASFINQNQGCSICGNKYKKSENKIKNLLDKNNIKYIYQYRNKFLDKKSLDFYIPKFNIAIEYQGGQHFIPVKIFGGEKSYNDTIKRDKEKYNICKENNIKILYFTYDLNRVPLKYIDKIYTDENELIKIIKIYNILK
jgi:ribosomal protein S27AE